MTNTSVPSEEPRRNAGNDPGPPSEQKSASDPTNHLLADDTVGIGRMPAGTPQPDGAAEPQSNPEANPATGASETTASGGPIAFSNRDFDRIVAKEASNRIPSKRLHDREDLMQDMHVGLHKASKKYDCTQGSPFAYAKAIVRNVAANDWALKTAAMRDVRRTQCWDTTKEWKTGEVLDRRHPRGSQQSRDGEDLKCDVREAVRELDAEEKKVAELLSVGYTSAKIASQLGVNLSDVNRCIRNIRSRFEHKGLREYIENPNTDRNNP